MRAADAAAVPTTKRRRANLLKAIRFLLVPGGASEGGCPYFGPQTGPWRPRFPPARAGPMQFRWPKSTMGKNPRADPGAASIARDAAAAFTFRCRATVRA